MSYIPEIIQNFQIQTWSLSLTNSLSWTQIRRHISHTSFMSSRINFHQAPPAASSSLTSSTFTTRSKVELSPSSHKLLKDSSWFSSACRSLDSPSSQSLMQVNISTVSPANRRHHSSIILPVRLKQTQRSFLRLTPKKLKLEQP